MSESYEAPKVESFEELLTEAQRDVDALVKQCQKIASRLDELDNVVDGIVDAIGEVEKRLTEAEGKAQKILALARAAEETPNVCD